MGWDSSFRWHGSQLGFLVCCAFSLQMFDSGAAKLLQRLDGVWWCLLSVKLGPGSRVLQAFLLLGCCAAVLHLLAQELAH